MNLTIALLSATRFVTKDKLREVVEGYRGLSDDAFNRLFERDKADLKKLGIPVMSGSQDVFFDDEIGYRIVREEFELPEITFDADELVALGSAARVWQQASAAQQSSTALAKLQAAGIDPDVAMDTLAPSIRANEPAFDLCWQATVNRHELRFRYRDGERFRHVQPWRVILRRNSWYLLGLDTDRDEPRLFKLSRIHGLPELVGEPAAFELPEGLDMAEVEKTLAPEPPDSTAIIAIAPHRAPRLRRSGAPVTHQHAVPQDWQCYRLDYAHSSDFLSQVVSVGADALVIEPAQLRRDVRRHLEGVVGSADQSGDASSDHQPQTETVPGGQGDEQSQQQGSSATSDDDGRRSQSQYAGASSMHRDRALRMLVEVPYLAAHPKMSVAQLATTFDITQQQVVRDLEMLTMCGLPEGLPDDLFEIDMDAVRGEGTISLSNAAVLSRPLKLTADEATSLIIALRVVEDIATGQPAQAAHSAIAKLQTIVPEDPSERIDLALATGDEQIRGRLQSACDQSQRIRLEYDNVYRGVTTHPVVDPARIQLRDGAAYLQAWSLDHDQWRHYRLDRIADVTLMDTPAGDHGEPPAEEAWFHDTHQHVVVDLDPSARWVVEYYPTNSTEELGDGGLRVSFPVGQPGWLTSILLRLGSAVRHVDPPQAGEPAHAAAHETLELYEHFFGSDT